MSPDLLSKLSLVFSAPLLRKDRYTEVVEERKRQAEEEQKKKEEAERKKKEEQEKKKKENEQKKKEEEEKKKLEAKDEKKKVDIKSRFVKAAWFSVDTLLKPVENVMDSVLGPTIDPFTDRHYIAWLSVVTLAFNYNTWFVTARLCFPYHTERAIPYWFALDLLADLIYLTDSIIFQARKQFVKGGDIIVSLRRSQSDTHHPLYYYMLSFYKDFPLHCCSGKFVFL